ncbi:hypothetical protein [Bdellovibrio sp. GT3]|uniref:hypothetical protein n=1 Tax=Bdellovibrio sp. GT3 TaxID=3136282 RepID=UPI0030F09C9A
MKLMIATLLLPMLGNAQVFGFKPVNSANQKVDAQSQIEIENLPPQLTQDTLGICYAVAASTLLTAENCRSMKTDCRTISEEQVFSPLGLAPLGRAAEDGDQKSTKSEDAAVDPYGGNIANALEELVSGGGFAPSEQCLSLDKILSRIGGAEEGVEVQLQIWSKLKDLYNKSKKIPKDCDSCSNSFYTTAKTEIEGSLNLNLSEADLLKAFGKKTYAEFFDRVMISPACKNLTKSLGLEFSSKREVKLFPETGKTGNYKQVLKTIKDVLTEGRPLGLGNICLDAKPSKKACQNQHAAVVAGYRKVCDPKGECVDSVKVLNSWGKGWQKANSDGWVDAKTLLDRTFYAEATLTWIEDKK